MATVFQTIQLRHGTAAAWTSANTVLAAGEAGVETDTLKVKVGNGSTAWNSLGYLGPSTGGVGSVAGDTHAASSKTPPVDADEFPIADSAASFAIKKVTFANLKTWVKTYYDAVASTLTNKTISGAANTVTNLGISSLSATGTPSASTFLRGDNAWTAPTAATLTTSRNIDGQAFNGSADITVIAPGTHAATAKSVPIDADEFPVVDTAASNVLKKTTLANLKTNIVTSTTVDGAGAVMNSDTSTAALAFVVDEDDMASNSATKVPTQQSVKAYVDSTSGGSAISALTVNAKGDMIVGTADNTVARKAVGVDNSVLIADSTQSDGLRWGPMSGGGSPTDPLTTKGDLVTRNASATTRKAVGTDGQLLVADSSQTDGLRWTSLLTSVMSQMVTQAVSSSATPTANTDTCDQIYISNLTTDITNFSTNLSGTPRPHQLLLVTIESAASQNITWGSKFEASSIPLPTASSGASSSIPVPVSSSSFAQAVGGNFSTPVPTGAASGLVAQLCVFIDPFSGASPTYPTLGWPSGFVEAANSPGTAQVNVFGTLTNLRVHVGWKRLSGADSGTYDTTLTGSQQRSALCVYYSGCVASGNPFEDTDVQVSSGAMVANTPSTNVDTVGGNRLLTLLSAATPASYSLTQPSGFSSFASITGGDPSAFISTKGQGAAGNSGGVFGTWTDTEGPQVAWLGALTPATTGGAGAGCIDVQFRWNATTSKWRCIGLS